MEVGLAEVGVEVGENADNNYLLNNNKIIFKHSKKKKEFKKRG